MKDNRAELIHEVDAVTKEIEDYELLINECEHDLEIINNSIIKLMGEIDECREQ